MNDLLKQYSYNSFTDLTLMIDEQNINDLINTFTIYFNKFANIMYLKNSGKLSINNQNNIYIQNWTPWRFIIRKIYRQSTLLSLIFIDQNISEYVIYIILIIELKDKLMDNFITLVYSNYNLIVSILPAIISLHNYYSFKGKYNIEYITYLKSIYNQLSCVNKQLKAEIDILNK